MGIKLSLFNKTPAAKPPEPPQKAVTAPTPPPAPKPGVTAPVAPPGAPVVKTGGLTIKRKEPVPPPISDKVVAYGDLTPELRKNVGKVAEAAPDIHVIPLNAKVRLTGVWAADQASHHTSWKSGDTGTVIASYTHGRPDHRPKMDLYKILLDKPRVTGKDEVCLNYMDIEEL